MTESEKQLPIQAEPGSVLSMRHDVRDMDDLWSHVSKADLIAARLGTMPDLHDAEIMAITLSRDGEPTVTLTLKAIPYDPTGQAGRYLITLLFKSVAGVSLTSFNQQNVIWGLYVKLNEDEKRLIIEPIWGVEGGFSFVDAVVLDASILPAKQA